MGHEDGDLCYFEIFKLYVTIGHVTLVAITRTVILVPYLSVKSLQLIWGLGTRRWNLRVPDLQMSCSDLLTKSRYQDSYSSNGHQVTYPTDGASLCDSQCWSLALQCCDLSEPSLYDMWNNLKRETFNQWLFQMQYFLLWGITVVHNLFVFQWEFPQ